MKRSARGLALGTAVILGLLCAVRPSFAVNPPVITSFTPSGGLAGINVTITGMHLGQTTSVTFHGTAATFTVVSSTQLTANVPVNATTGRIGVVTPYGMVNSPTKFVVAPIAHVV